MIPTWICVVGLGLYAVQVVIGVVTGLTAASGVKQSLRLAEEARRELMN